MLYHEFFSLFLSCPLAWSHYRLSHSYQQKPKANIIHLFINTVNNEKYWLVNIQTFAKCAGEFQTAGSACVLHILDQNKKKRGRNKTEAEKQTNKRATEPKKNWENKSWTQIREGNTRNGNWKINFQLKVIFNYKIFCMILKRRTNTSLYGFFILYPQFCFGRWICCAW